MQQRPYNPYAAPEARQQAPRKETAIVSGARLRRMRTPLERFVGFALLLGSIAGNVLAFNAGRIYPVTALALGLGIGAQAFLTFLQWVYSPHGRMTAVKWQYLASVAVGTGLSIAGYATVLYTPALRLFAARPQLQVLIVGVPVPILATWILITVVSLVLEVIPENILVD